MQYRVTARARDFKESATFRTYAAAQDYAERAGDRLRVSGGLLEMREDGTIIEQVMIPAS